MFLIAGVYIGFWGSMIDNAWWGVAWSADYLELPFRNFFFHNGVYPNTFFRQTALIIAGGLHVHAENMAKDTERASELAKKKTRRVVIFSIIAGVAYVALLVALRGMM